MPTPSQQIMYLYNIKNIMQLLTNIKQQTDLTRLQFNHNRHVITD